MKTNKDKIHDKHMGRATRKRVSGHADSEGPDQTAHPRSLIRAFTSAQCILQNV